MRPAGITPSGRPVPCAQCPAARAGCLVPGASCPAAQCPAPVPVPVPVPVVFATDAALPGDAGHAANPDPAGTATAVVPCAADAGTVRHRMLDPSPNTTTSTSVVSSSA